jgi:hypothetical protein
LGSLPYKMLDFAVAIMTFRIAICNIFDKFVKCTDEGKGLLTCCFVEPFYVVILRLLYYFMQE